MKLSANFSLSEFESKDGAPMPPDVRANVERLATHLQVLRDTIKLPITITSGYRSPAHNKKIGGAPQSYHTRGMAADIQVNGITPSELAATITALVIEGKMRAGGIGRYSRWVHYDIRGTHIRFR